MAAQTRRLLVATDLDATLLDHQTYSYEAALPALKQLKTLACPVIFNSSKTEAEQIRLRTEIGLQAPFIVENGAAVVIPAGQLGRTAAETQVFGPSYDALTTQVAKIRQTGGYRFRGFTDMSIADVAELTGLSEAAAAAAKQRRGSEPLYWEDTEPAFEAFRAAVAQLGLQTTQGGRFRHVMAQADKGTALDWLVQQYRQHYPNIDWCVVALGDSPNDLPMLQTADIGVHVPNPHRQPFELTAIKRLVVAPAPGPSGWAAAIAEILSAERFIQD
ncbi:MAG: HAD-IIB family hydrolase [Cyanobacteria bacterium J06632_22]